MGGETVLSSPALSEENLSLDQDFQHGLNSVLYSGDEDTGQADTDNVSFVNGEIGMGFGKFPNSGYQISYTVEGKRRRKVYADVLESYEELQSRSERLEEAKRRILSYVPGSCISKWHGKDLSDYDVPETTSLLLVGPKGSGKSSLVNKISRVFEDDMFSSERAQVSYNSEDGTYFLHEYMIPRGSGSFCLYDTRGLSDDSSENRKMLKCWMTNGVRHGELIRRKSDSETLKAELKCKARRISFPSIQAKMINFVIFVVDGLSVLESIDGDDNAREAYNQFLAAAFNNPFLSFRDDKPAIVITHGDLLSLYDRVRIRVHLGHVLGVSPTRQVFDIPDKNDSSTALTVVDMLTYCLEHAEKNLPGKDMSISKVDKLSLPSYMLTTLVMCIAMICVSLVPIVRVWCLREPRTSLSSSVDWHDPNTSSSIDCGKKTSSSIDINWHDPDTLSSIGINRHEYTSSSMDSDLKTLSSNNRDLHDLNTSSSINSDPNTSPSIDSDTETWSSVDSDCHDPETSSSTDIDWYAFRHVW